MSAHEELTAALAAVRMSEERRVSIARLVERAINEAVATIRGASRGGVAVARSARDDHTMEHGHASDVNVIDARAIIEHAKEKTP